MKNLVKIEIRNFSQYVKEFMTIYDEDYNDINRRNEFEDYLNKELTFPGEHDKDYCFPSFIFRSRDEEVPYIGILYTDGKLAVLGGKVDSEVTLHEMIMLLTE